MVLGTGWLYRAARGSPSVGQRSSNRVSNGRRNQLLWKNDKWQKIETLLSKVSYQSLFGRSFSIYNTWKLLLNILESCLDLHAAQSRPTYLNNIHNVRKKILDIFAPELATFQKRPGIVIFGVSRNMVMDVLNNSWHISNWYRFWLEMILRKVLYDQEDQQLTI